MTGVLCVLSLLMLPTLLHKLCCQGHVLQDHDKVCNHPRISVMSKCYVATTMPSVSRKIKNDTTQGHSAKNEFDTNADTCCAGPNW